MAAPTGQSILPQERGRATALVSAFLIVVSATPAVTPRAPPASQLVYFNDSNEPQGATRRLREVLIGGGLTLVASVALVVASPVLELRSEPASRPTPPMEC